MTAYGNAPVAKAAAASRVQRYWNKGTKSMQTAQEMHPTGHPAPAAGTTSGGAKRYWNAGAHEMQVPHKGFEGHPAAPATSAPATSTAPTQPVSIINMSIPEITARAKLIVDNQIRAERVPFQTRGTQIGQEGASEQAAHQAAYGQQDTALAGLQTGQATGAKTFANQAADALAQAASQNVVDPNAPESTKKQQEASRTLLTGIASAGQAGTNQRQEAESNLLTNLRAAAGTNAVGQSGQIAGTYAKRSQENADKKTAMEATGPGRRSKLQTELEGEVGKLRQAKETSEGKFGLDWAKLRQQELGSQRTAATAAAGQRNTANIAAADRAQKAADAKWKREHPGQTKGSGSGKTKGSGGKVTAAEGLKYAAGINSAYSVVHQEIEATKRQYPHANAQEVYKYAFKQLEQGAHTGSGGKAGEAMPANMIHAAMSLIYNNGKLIGGPRQEAIENGLNPNSPWLH